MDTRLKTAIAYNDIRYLGDRPIREYKRSDLAVALRAFGLDVLRTVIVPDVQLDLILMIEFNNKLPMPDGNNDDVIVCNFISIIEKLMSMHEDNLQTLFSEMVWDEFGDIIKDSLTGVSPNNQYIYRAYNVMAALHNRRYNRICYK